MRADRDALVIVDAVRTPRGRGNQKGALAGVHPVDLLAGLAVHVRDKHELARHRVVDAVIGCVTQVGDQGGNVARAALVQAGVDAPATTINRFCASSLSAVVLAGKSALVDDALALAGGVESMSRVPMASDHGALVDDIERQRALGVISIGVAADIIATLEGFTREQCDAYACESQKRASASVDLERSLVPVCVPDLTNVATTNTAPTMFTHDECARPATTLASLAALPLAFTRASAHVDVARAHLPALAPFAAITHVHTAGSSPAPADGASLVLLGSASAVARAGLRARGRIVAAVEHSSDRTLALTGIVDATRAALAQAHLTIDDIDLFEVNESFAALMLYYQKHLAVPALKLNVNGGAIALGHPMGATGAILLGSALDELERRQQQRALVAVSGAAGLTTAVIIERVP